MNEVATQGSNLPANAAVGAWGAENVSAKDTLIPRLLLQQDLSDLVKKRRAEVGDMVHSQTGEVMGKPGKAIEIIPIYSYVDWIVNDVVNGKDKFSHSVRENSENTNWQYEMVVEGKPVHNIRRLNFFVVIPGKLEDLPTLVSFKSMSMPAGKKLMTHFAQCQTKRIPPASQTFKLVSTQKTKDTYQFYTFDVENGRDTTSDELAAAFKWYQTIRNSDVKVDDEFKSEDPTF